MGVPVLRETSNAKKKRFVWSLGIDPDFPNFLVDDNHYQDKLLIRRILQESPWRVKHGAQKTSSETIMSSLADQQHHSKNVFEGASLIKIRQRYEGYLNLARRWTLEREKHNQEEKSEDEECDVPSSWITKKMIKHGILDIYEDVQLFEEELKNGKRVNEEKEVTEFQSKRTLSNPDPNG